MFLKLRQAAVNIANSNAAFPSVSLTFGAICDYPYVQLDKVRQCSFPMPSQSHAKCPANFCQMSDGLGKSRNRIQLQIRVATVANVITSRDAERGV